MCCDAEMPRYKCHKIVYALKIADIQAACGDRVAAPNEESDGGMFITPADDGYAPFRAKHDWPRKFHGSKDDFGYYVVYENGYASWSPTKAFEEGYEKL